MCLILSFHMYTERVIGAVILLSTAAVNISLQRVSKCEHLFHVSVSTDRSCVFNLKIQNES